MSTRNSRSHPRVFFSPEENIPVIVDFWATLWDPITLPPRLLRNWQAASRQVAVAEVNTDENHN
jgi:thioredoxin-like negative regulator of GroEL